MSRPAAAVQDAMLGNLPTGWIWPGRGAPSLIAAVLAPFAQEVADLEAAAEAMLDEIDPRTATLCIADFERVLGPDPCGRETVGLSIAERRQLAHQRWTGRGGQSIAYFTALAAARGVEIVVREVHVSRAGLLRAGDELVNAPEQFVWSITVALGGWSIFRVGESVAGDRLWSFTLSDVECDIRRAKPAHTEVVFRYVEPPDTTLVFDGYLGLSGLTEAGAQLELTIEEA